VRAVSQVIDAADNDVLDMMRYARSSKKCWTGWMSPHPGEVWLADLGLAAKTRPVVIVSRHDPDAPRALAIDVPLTTQKRGSRYEVELPRLPFLRERASPTFYAVILSYFVADNEEFLQNGPTEISR
jgi:mRNA interferase MazF